MKYKFRAYNKLTKTMVILDPLQWPLKALDEEENWKVMMWTGLLDRRGKEIYEGDILATSQTDPESDHDMWEEEEYGYTVVEWSGWHCGFRGSNWMWYHDSSLQYGLEFIRVIGNIYENPELLEDK